MTDPHTPARPDARLVRLHAERGDPHARLAGALADLEGADWGLLLADQAALARQLAAAVGPGTLRVDPRVRVDREALATAGLAAANLDADWRGARAVWLLEPTPEDISRARRADVSVIADATLAPGSNWLAQGAALVTYRDAVTLSGYGDAPLAALFGSGRAPQPVSAPPSDLSVALALRDVATLPLRLARVARTAAQLAERLGGAAQAAGPTALLLAPDAAPDTESPLGGVRAAARSVSGGVLLSPGLEDAGAVLALLRLPEGAGSREARGQAGGPQGAGARSPELGRPDTRHPDTSRPDTGRPDTGRPDTGRPETSRSDTGQPGPGGVSPDAMNQSASGAARDDGRGERREFRGGRRERPDRGDRREFRRAERGDRPGQPDRAAQPDRSAPTERSDQAGLSGAPERFAFEAPPVPLSGLPTPEGVPATGEALSETSPAVTSPAGTSLSVTSPSGTVLAGAAPSASVPAGPQSPRAATPEQAEEVWEPEIVFSDSPSPAHGPLPIPVSSGPDAPNLPQLPDVRHLADLPGESGSPSEGAGSPEPDGHAQATGTPRPALNRPSFPAAEAQDTAPVSLPPDLPGGKEDPAANLTDEQNAIYMRLRDWRNTEAKRLAISRFIIASNATLAEIARRIPFTETDLKAVKGMGPERLRKYGERILDIVRG